jgi:predicted enzyme related to lactoylglutathione lyase
MGQPVAFFEISSPDQERAQKFYRELFDWQVDADPSMGGYALVDTRAGEGAIIGGIGSSTGPSDVGIKIYMKVEDLDAYLRRAEELGGSAVVPPTELPGDFGKFAVLADPDGNAVGLWA